MGRKRTYKILLSDEDKKVLHTTIHNKKLAKRPSDAARFFWSWMKRHQGISLKFRLQKLLASAIQPYQMLFSLI